MKKLFLIGFLLASSVCIAKFGDRYNIVAGTNSISVSGVRYPLNTIALKISPDSVFVQLFNVSQIGEINAAITPRDSFKHFYNNGTAFTSVSQFDSLYQQKFVK